MKGCQYRQPFIISITLFQAQEASVTVDQRAIAAAANNADLYEAVFASRGLRFTRYDHAFVGHDCPPPYYSNLTVLLPGRTEEIMGHLSELARIFGGVVGCKDSFCELDLHGNGFEALFGASWIWRDATTHAHPVGWDVVRGVSALSQWEAQWKAGGSPTEERMFPEAMLERPDIVFLKKQVGHDIAAGCIANISKGCIGISNIFGADVFDEAAAAVSLLRPNMPVVGYESGEMLKVALSCGFHAVGELKIMLARQATF
jgi:hypothetical protein